MHGILFGMEIDTAFQSFFQLMLLIFDTAVYFLTGIRLWRSLHQEKNKKAGGIFFYMTTLYSIHLVSFLNVLYYGKLPLFERPDNILSFLFIISRFTLFVSVPAFIHGLFPYNWAKKVHITCIVFGLGLFVTSLLEIMPAVGYTIAVYSILIVLGVYAILYGFISSLHFPGSRFRSSKEFQYALVALGSFLISIPFMIPMDFTLIPQGFLDGHYYLFRYHSLLSICGFFCIGIINRGHWLNQGQPKEEISHRVILATDVIKDNELTKREAQIYLLLLEHKSYKEITDTLGISVPTAKTHILNLYRKLNINKKSELPGLHTPHTPGSQDSYCDTTY
jgi:DNA-binding CsgD family transcriptional regulator